ncbi:MAG: fumarylacetoacetate hydrolase family protein [Pseudomonadota bacterium]|nr:fumarylacetoacetate hydrolase family protein [Pseudomonadota bacterium]
MKFASLRSNSRDGILVLVDRELNRAFPAGQTGARTLQAALDDWARIAPRLETLYLDLNQDDLDAFPLNPFAITSPLPRAYQWLDGSAYLSHVERVRKARGAPMPANSLTDPLMYQGNSGSFLGPRDPIGVTDETWGLDFEAEIAVVTDDVPMGVSPEEARSHIQLVMLVNDVSLRNLIPQELAKGFGFLHSKPGSAFSPVAVTPDELGGAWDGGKLHLPLITYLNGSLFGKPNAGEDMQFDFPALIAHAARTRKLPAGTIIGSGTVSNTDPARGCSCIVERRVLEQLESGAVKTPYLQPGDQIRIEVVDSAGHSLFGAIEQQVQVERR